LKESQEQRNKYHVENLNLSDKIADMKINLNLLEKTLKVRDNELTLKMTMWDEKIKSIEKENSNVIDLSRQLNKFFVELSENQ
jgi:hypothetical protein